MSHDTGQGVDDWCALASTISPRSPRLSTRATSPTSRRTIPPSAAVYASSVTPTPRWATSTPLASPTRSTPSTPRARSPGGLQLAFVAARPDIDEVRVVAPDGTGCTTISPGQGWHVEDLHWIDEDCLAAIVAPRNSDSAVGLGSLRGTAGSGPMTWDNDSGRRRLVTLDLRTGHLERLDTVQPTVWEMCPLDRRPVRRDRLGRTDRVRLVRSSAVGAGRRRARTRASRSAVADRRAPGVSGREAHRPRRGMGERPRVRRRRRRRHRSRRATRRPRGRSTAST